MPIFSTIKKLNDVRLSINNKWRQIYWKIRLKRAGKDFKISGRAVIYQASKMTVGNNCVLNDFVHVWAGGVVNIGDGVLIAAHSSITSVSHDVDAVSKKLKYYQTRETGPVNIGNNVWIGTGAIILPGVSIGDNSIIGAGCVVNIDIPENSIAVGVPVKIKRKIKT